MDPTGAKLLHQKQVIEVRSNLVSECFRIREYADLWLHLAAGHKDETACLTVAR